MMYALVWVIKDFIMGFHNVGNSSPVHSPGSGGSGVRDDSFSDSQHDSDESGSDSEAGSVLDDAPSTPKTHARATAIFDSSDVSNIVDRICLRLHVIRCTCQGFDLTSYMCDEPRRVFQQMTKGAHSMTAYLRAHEYMILSMLMPYVLVDLMQPEMQWLSEQYEGDPPVEIASRISCDPMQQVVQAWYMYMDFFCCFRKQSMTESEVCELQAKGRELQKFLWVAFPHKGGQKMAWNFVKFHHIDALASIIRMFGSGTYASTQATEHCHVFYSRKLIELTNGKNAFNQIMHMVVRGHVLRDLALFNKDDGHLLHDAYNHETYKYSRSQVYAFPVDMLFREPEKVTRTLASCSRAPGSNGSKVLYDHLSSFVGAEAEDTWGKKHRGFLFLPHLLGSFLVTRRKRYNILLPDLEKVRSCTLCIVPVDHAVGHMPWLTDIHYYRRRGE